MACYHMHWSHRPSLVYEGRDYNTHVYQEQGLIEFLFRGSIPYIYVFQWRLNSNSFSIELLLDLV